MMIKKFKIDSELFWRIFDKALNEESSKEDDLLGSYKGNSYKRTIGEKKLHPWTKVMERTYYTMEKKLQCHFNVVEANILNLYCNNYNENKGVELKRPEYLNIDATFFDESEYFDDSIFEILGLSNDYKKVWNLLLAVEHENNYKTSIHEVKQLLQVKCPLRVSISYLKHTH